MSDAEMDDEVRVEAGMLPADLLPKCFRLGFVGGDRD
jgi:hypothetical protein